MSRKSIVVLGLALIGAAIAATATWSWYHERQRRAQVNALMTELSDHGEQVARESRSFPITQIEYTNADLDRMSALLDQRLREMRERSRALQNRTEEVIPIAPDQQREELRDVLTVYVHRLGEAQELYMEHLKKVRNARAMRLPELLK